MDRKEAPTTFISDGVKSQKMIITCEVCKKAFHYDVVHEEDVEVIFSNFQCDEKCDRNFYSYITVGRLFIDDLIEDAIAA